QYLMTRLPDYMVPARFVILEHLPLSPNGKVDRRALPRPVLDSPGADSSTPQSDIERRLMGIWKDVLSVDHVGRRDSFFDLGGHSLLAVRMFARLEDSLGIRLPLATLFHTPTIEALAEVIGHPKEPASWRCLVPIQSGGSRAPLFGVPGVGGNVLCYNDLARLMGPDRPFYGLQSRGLDGMEKPLTRIEHIAAVFLEEVREVQPTGPYNLVGACMGGVVAFEMAQQLRAAGEEVAQLVLLETWLPGPAAVPAPRPGSRSAAFAQLLAGRLRLYATTLAQLRGRQRLHYLGERLRTLKQMIAQRDVFRGDRTELHLHTVMQANLAALDQYAPRVYPGKAVFFRAAQRNVAAEGDGRLVWRQLISGGVETYSIPGADSGMMLMEPAVHILAQRLKSCIEIAQPSREIRT